jgi:8-oxo-dGTP pyrophosphatase MutT (NUDIX family)
VAPGAPARPLRVAGQVIGAVHEQWHLRLLQAPTPFRLTPDGALTLDPVLDDFESRTQALDQWAQQVRARWPIAGWRDERIVVLLDSRPGLAIERALLRPLGLCLRSVQASVYAMTATGPRLWIARRALSKPVDPGCLDALVAGGIAGSDDALSTLIRECAEEAGIDSVLARQALPCGTLDICYDTSDEGLKVRHRESVALYELELPQDFRPVAVDGEHAEILAMTPLQAWQSSLQDAWTPDGAQATRALIARRQWLAQALMQA